ncbi:hypothetical protein V6N11_056087 [Hibiscus sabdariffa]|uniref:Uncharacterized protein n=1 Tax=Hibiscus sabdariffa TaxID=183260 RepID=A0ABR2T312_9ROSI
MQNPNSIEPSNVVIFPIAVGLDAANHGGLPPDNSMCVDIPTSIECPRSPMSADGSHINKKDSVLVRPVSDIAMGDGGSQFATLVDIPDSKVHVEGSDPTSYDRRMASMSLASKDNLVGVSRSPSSRNRVHGVTNGVGSDGDVVAEHLNGSSLIQDQLAVNKKSDNERSKVSLGTSVRVASQGRVVAAKSSLNANKHVAVQVLDSTLNPGPRVGKGRIFPSSLRGGISKPVTKKPVGTHSSKNMGPKQAKRDDRHSSSSSLAAGLSNLMEDLTNAETWRDRK